MSEPYVIDEHGTQLCGKCRLPLTLTYCGLDKSRLHCENPNCDIVTINPHQQPRKVNITKELIPWSDFRARKDNLSATEQAVFQKCFTQYVNGNDFFDDLSAAEMETYYNTFLDGWLMHELFTKDV